MKLESLQLDKFKDSALKKEQMFKLNGGDTATPGGHACRIDEQGRTWEFDYGFDAIRDGGLITLHNRTNNVLSDGQCVANPSFMQPQ